MDNHLGSVGSTMLEVLKVNEQLRFLVISDESVDLILCIHLPKQYDAFGDLLPAGLSGVRC